MIVLKDLYKKFGTLQVLAGLNLEVKAGEVLVILGPSGTGKSVLLKHIIGICKPDSGSIEVNGVEITHLEGAELYQITIGMGMLFQGAALFDSMTVEENTAFFLREHGHIKEKRAYSEKEIEEIVDFSLSQVGLKGTQKKMPASLSGGMKKRAGLARLIAYRPSLLLYDEPTTGLDPITSMQINELIVQTQKELQGTSIVVTHDIFSALFIADRIALMKEGKIAYIADPENFLKIDDPLINFLKRTICEDPRSFKRKA